MPDSDLSLLFSQLQSRYPTSSLVTELVQIHEQRFVVRALVQLGGTPLATGLAAAETVEQAEDQARSRVLMLLGIGASGTPVPLSSGSLVGMAPYPRQAQLLSSPLDAGSLPQSGAANLPPVLEPLADPFGDFSVPPAIEPMPLSAGRSSVVGGAAPETVPPKPDPAPKSRKSRTATPPPVEAAIAPGFDAVNTLENSTLENSSLENSDFSPTLPEEPLPDFFASPPEASTETLPPFTESADLSELIALTDVEMQRVGWTRKRGQTHLKQTYDKDKRADLDEAQLMEFLHFLRALPSRYEPGE